MGGINFLFTSLTAMGIHYNEIKLRVGFDIFILYMKVMNMYLFFLQLLHFLRN